MGLTWNVPHRLMLWTHVLQLVAGGTLFRGCDDLQEERSTRGSRPQSQLFERYILALVLILQSASWSAVNGLQHRLPQSWLLPCLPRHDGWTTVWNREPRQALPVFCCFCQVSGYSDTKVSNSSLGDSCLLYLTLRFVNPEQMPCLDVWVKV